MTAYTQECTPYVFFYSYYFLKINNKNLELIEISLLFFLFKMPVIDILRRIFIGLV